MAAAENRFQFDADGMEDYFVTTSYLYTASVNDTLSSSTGSSSNGSSLARSDPESNKVILHAIFLYTLPFIIIAGTVGNVMSFAVLVRSQMRNTSVYFYLMALAVADTCVLFLSAFKTWIRVLTGKEMLHMSDVSCKLINFLFMVTLHLSAWLIVLVTVDRFVAVWFPFKASFVCTVTRARLATTVLVTVVLLYSSHLFWTIHLQTYQNNSDRFFCGHLRSSKFMSSGFEYLKLASYSLVPFIIILVLNVAIITRLRWKPLLLRGSNGANPNFCGAPRSDAQGNNCGRQTKVTYMLLAVSFAWLVLTFPNALHTLIVNKENQEAHNFFRAVSFLLMYTNHAINFYLYCITGKKFRHELEEMSRSACNRSSPRNGSGSAAYSPSRKSPAGLTRTNIVDIELHETMLMKAKISNLQYDRPIDRL